MVYTISSGNDVETNKVLEKGCVWKEFLFAFLASIPFFTHGVQSTTLTSTAHAGHFIAQDGVPWSTTAFILGTIVAAPILCYVADRFGRKVSIFIICLVHGTSCIPLLLEINDINIIILHTLAGISAGGIFTVLPLYIREISSIKNRGLALSLMIPMTSAGYLMKLAMTFDTLIFLMVALVIVQMLIIFSLIESPSYFVMVGKYERAQKIMATLKCLPHDHETVLENITTLKDESNRAKSKGKLHMVTILKNPIWRDATKIGLVLQTTMILGGSIVFLDQNKSLEQLRIAEDPDKLLVLLCMFAGSLFCLLAIIFLERKYLLTLAYSVMVLSMGVLAVYTQTDLTVTLRWAPVVSLGILVFGYGISWGLPTVVITELFNLEIRSHQLAFLYTYSQLIKLAHVHSFPYIEDYMGIYTLFYIFASVNLFGAVYCIFHMPNLKNKSTRQIERQLKRIPLLKL